MFSSEEKANVAPFFTNLDKPVYAPLIFSPELIGALCSRSSRAAGDLRRIFLDEYITPFLNPEREEKDSNEDWQAKLDYAKQTKEFINFIQKHPLEKIFSNPRARQFYAKWLAQYGDDSIAQMAGAHIVFAGLSQLAIKHFQDQRIGLAPLEKSTRYVNYSEKIDGKYLYYTDSRLADLGLKQQYESAMNGLFETYTNLLEPLQQYLQNKFPEEKKSVVEKKAFDTLRGLLPVATLSQVAFYGNGQAFEYMMARSLKHPMNEIRWAADQTYQELSHIVPAFIRRVKDEAGQTTAADYQEYLALKNTRITKLVPPLNKGGSGGVKLLEYDPKGEDKVIAGILYAADNNHASWQENLDYVTNLSEEKKHEILKAYLGNRSQRWQKVGRAFENTYVRFEITMNIGGWRDLHRHRMLTQQRQFFTTKHGYDLPQDIIDASLAPQFQAAIQKAEEVHAAIAKHDPHLAQYAVTLAHRVRFQQWKNLRECFWEMELRTIPEGHPDYRIVEQEKFKLLQEVFPLITQHMLVNIGNYDFARRGQEEKIQSKLEALEKI